MSKPSAKTKPSFVFRPIGKRLQETQGPQVHTGDSAIGGRIPTLRLDLSPGQHRLQSGGHAILVVRPGEPPAPAAEVFRRISHDNRVSGKGKHFYVVVIVSDGHNLPPGDAPICRPALQSVAFRSE